MRKYSFLSLNPGKTTNTQKKNNQIINNSTGCLKKIFKRKKTEKFSIQQTKKKSSSNYYRYKWKQRERERDNDDEKKKNSGHYDTHTHKQNTEQKKIFLRVLQFHSMFFYV